MADSWLIDGNCESCRRKNYCSKPCTKNKQAVRQVIRNVVRKKMVEAMISPKPKEDSK